MVSNIVNENIEFVKYPLSYVHIIDDCHVNHANYVISSALKQND